MHTLCSAYFCVELQPKHAQETPAPFADPLLGRYVIYSENGENIVSL